MTSQRTDVLCIWRKLSPLNWPHYVSTDKLKELLEQQETSRALRCSSPLLLLILTGFF